MSLTSATYQQPSINSFNQDPKSIYALNDYELQYRKSMKKYLCAATDLSPGNVISQENTFFKRVPGGTIGFDDAELVYGSKVLDSILFEDPITFDKLKSDEL